MIRPGRLVRIGLRPRLLPVVHSTATKHTVLVSLEGVRLHWRSFDTDISETAESWRVRSLVLASLFLQAGLWYYPNNNLFLSGPSLPSTVALAAISLCIGTLFFVLPALAVRAAGQTLYTALGHSMGSLPVVGVRLCAALFLADWLCRSCTICLWLLGSTRETEWQQRLFAGALLFYLLVTSQQSLSVGAKLTELPNKLALCILFVALLRVRTGLPSAFSDPMGADSLPVQLAHTWTSFSILCGIVSPLLLLTVDVAARAGSRRTIVLTGLMGVALPLFGTQFLAGVIAASVGAAGLYRPSLTPSVGMALLAYRSANAELPLSLLLGVTMFGAARLMARGFLTAAGLRFGRDRSRWRDWCLLSAAILVMNWRAPLPFSLEFPPVLIDFLARVLAACCAILTVDFLGFAKQPNATTPPGRVDWIGCLALLSGAVAPELPQTHWDIPAPLPAYAVSALVCVAGRRVWRSRLFSRASGGRDVSTLSREKCDRN